MIRSGRATTHTDAITNTSRARAARPSQPAPARSTHCAGDSAEANDWSLAAAVKATTNSTVPTSASIHTERMNLMVITYSGPSGQASAISATAPNNAMIDIVERNRPNHSAPPADPSASDCAAAVPGLCAADSLMISTESSSSCSLSGVTAVCTENVITPETICSPRPSRSAQLTAQVPRGSGSGISTSTWVRSPSTSGIPVTCAALPHANGAVSASSAPRRFSNTNSNDSGDALKVAPSAGSVETRRLARSSSGPADTGPTALANSPISPNATASRPDATIGRIRCAYPPLDAQAAPTPPNGTHPSALKLTHPCDVIGVR